MPTTTSRNQRAHCYGAPIRVPVSITSRDHDADESRTSCLASIWLIAAISRISVSENWRTVLFVILNIAETPEIRPEHRRLHTFVRLGSARPGKSRHLRRLRWELPVDRCAHSHSINQFLQHLPSHWYSNIFPPHCGQTRLMIDEIMFAFDSRGIV